MSGTYVHRAQLDWKITVHGDSCNSSHQLPILEQRDRKMVRAFSCFLLETHARFDQPWPEYRTPLQIGRSGFKLSGNFRLFRPRNTTCIIPQPHLHLFILYSSVSRKLSASGSARLHFVELTYNWNLERVKPHC